MEKPDSTEISKIIEQQNYDFYSKHRLDQLLEEVERFRAFFSDKHEKMTLEQQLEITKIILILQGVYLGIDHFEDRLDLDLYMKSVGLKKNET